MHWYKAGHAADKNNTNGFKIYTSPVQLGIDIKNITSLVEIINKMSDYSAFYYLTDSPVDGLYSKKLVPAEYGSLQVTRYNINRVILEFTGSGTGYHNFYNHTYAAFYHTSQGNVSEW